MGGPSTQVVDRERIMITAMLLATIPPTDLCQLPTFEMKMSMVVVHIKDHTSRDVSPL